MTDAPGTRPPLVSHVSVGVSDLARAGAFYDAALAPLGVRRVMEHPMGIAWGRSFPEFWASRPHDRAPPSAGNGVHVCFNAPDQAAVAAFHAAGVAAGGRDDGPPGLRPDYAPGYYAAFLRDPDGNKVEALCWVAQPAAT
ncbi:VOC family protein [Brevundimonas sp.]|jgi:catechol 2,3-dioxygenase-like lactoylglutathione lyase family enzyme|uniref:VOC family protein n=1 Tax=Brevundimonas sp. TaxID=1871086 RepID=UPI00120786E9|nr:VOC family protein [Brevundimonas sp.]TAJ64161.1 MAG: VOC family protein [Brevundimonas sp.]